ncbi:MAG: type VII secretion protein EccE [Gordonia sp. (in: high G+C Gram-positive bacteria)]
MGGESLTTVDAAVGVSPRTSGRLRVRRLAPAVITLLVIEVLLALALAVWALAGMWAGPAACGVAVALSMATIAWSGPSPATRALRRIGYAGSRLRRTPPDPAPPPFDIPALHRPAPTGTEPEPVVGVRWVDGTLITVLRVRPGRLGVSRLAPGTLGFDEPRGMLVPLTVLADCIDPFDIPLTAIDVVSHGVRAWGSGPAATAYRRTLGPLPASAHRTVLVILRLNPNDCPDAVARRGGGAEGALRAAAITTRRVHHRLVEAGLGVTILTAAEIATATGALIDGHRLDAVSERWDHLIAGPLRLRSAAVAPGALPELLTAVWSVPSVATTLSIRLAHNDDGLLRVGALVRFDDLADESGRHVADLPAGLVPLPGRQFEALTTALPVAAAATFPGQVPVAAGTTAAALLARLHVPAGGCGQLLGADVDGTAIAMALAGPGIDTVRIEAQWSLAALLVVRAAAIGLPVAVHSSTPERWDTVLAAIGEDAPAGHDSGIEVFDGVEPGDRPGAGTRFVIVDPTRSTLTPTPGPATIVLTQNPDSPQQVTVALASGRHELTVVATPDEWALIGPTAPPPA